jgi:Right handed beta helix region
MATINVSNSSELKSALSKAGSGDTIQLAGGSYGSLSLSGKGGVTIKGNGDATFSAVSLRNASNVTLDNVTFAGALKANGGSNITVTNSDFRDTAYGATFLKVSGLKVTNNHVTDMTYDAFRFGGVTNVTISGNTYQERGSKPGPNHKDFIQFWTEGTGPSKGITITNNKFYSDDGSTHGIFMNGDNYSGGAFQNVTIANNYFKSSHTHGITVAHANGLEIRNNTLIQDGKYPPLINVTSDSRNVQIIGNTAPSVPDEANSSWVVSGNKETGRGTHWDGGQNGSAVANTGAGAIAPSAALAEDGDGDVIRFSGLKLDKGVTKAAAEVDFDAGDTLLFVSYDRGTFEGAGGNGTHARIESLAELEALDEASSDVSLAEKAGALIVEIDQGAATHRIALDLDLLL